MAWPIEASYRGGEATYAKYGGELMRRNRKAYPRRGNYAARKQNQRKEVLDERHVDFGRKPGGGRAGRRGDGAGPAHQHWEHWEC